MSHFLARFCLVLALSGVIALVLGSAGASALTLTPPPPPNATCESTGSGILCHGDFAFSDTNFHTGIICASSFEVLVSDTGTVTYDLRYNSAGLALQGTFHQNSQGIFSNSATGNTIGNDSHFSSTLDFATPGELSTATATLTGALGIATGQSIGLVAHDVGKVVFDPSGNILFEGGPHNSLDNTPAFVQAICGALS